MIDRLYEASQAGVEIDLIVRGICCLIPGQEYSHNIRVTRIVDTFLEHARVWYFGNGGAPKLFLGSPDWMRRNLYRRIEAVTPHSGPGLEARAHRYAIHTTVRQTESLLCGRPVAKPLEVVATAKGEGTVANIAFTNT